ncbi:MAG: hypothetical protein IPO21_19000 [Bacteroidales bacterium]|nr:hypothetical protein [Bacteroidales bacterium]
MNIHSQLGVGRTHPTNNCYANENHIQLAVGRDFTDCTSVKGTFKGPAYQEMMVYVSVGYEDGTVFEDETAVQLVNGDGLKEPMPVIHIKVNNNNRKEKFDFTFC